MHEASSWDVGQCRSSKRRGQERIESLVAHEYNLTNWLIKDIWPDSFIRLTPVLAAWVPAVSPRRAVPLSCKPRPRSLPSTALPEPAPTRSPARLGSIRP